MERQIQKKSKGGGDFEMDSGFSSWGYRYIAGCPIRRIRICCVRIGTPDACKLPHRGCLVHGMGVQG